MRLVEFDDVWFNADAVVAVFTWDWRDERGIEARVKLDGGHGLHLGLGDHREDQRNQFGRLLALIDRGRNEPPLPFGLTPTLDLMGSE